MIERAPAQTPAGYGPGRVADDVAGVLHRRIAEAEQASVVRDARETLALKSVVSGVPVAELARRADAIDNDTVDWRAYVVDADAAFRREAAVSAERAKRIDAALAQRGVAS